ncbi:MAG: hypothetical protein HYX48_07805 [Chlamydiales bacterium]|nr:hypothetical protein [Chlamydiales bacterium]
MRKELLSFALLFFLLLASLVRLDRFFLKENDGFCFHNISGRVPAHVQRYIDQTSLSPSGWEKISSQKFCYLTRGHQSYVFLSEDGNYVLKFYRFPSHLRAFSQISHPLSYQFNKKRQEIKTYNLQKLADSFQSFSLAHQELKQETGLVMVHLQTDDGSLERRVQIQDKLGVNYSVELGKLPFILQRRAKLIFPYLDELCKMQKKEEIKTAVTKIVNLIADRMKKGIVDSDAILEKNYGWLDDHPIHIDIGRFSRDESAKFRAREEAEKITAPLRSWLESHAPDLLPHYDHTLQHLSS